MRITRFTLGAIAALALRNNPNPDGGGGGTPDPNPKPAAGDGGNGDNPTPQKTPDEIKAEQVAAIKGVLKLPDNSTIDTAVVERTAAIASELGLSTDHAPKVLELVHQEATAHADARVTAALDAHKPGGAEWTKQQETWKADALKDPDLGNGDPEKLNQVVEAGRRVLAKYGDQETITYLEQTGLGSHPAALKLFKRLGAAMAEDKLVDPKGGPPAAPRDPADIMYGAKPAA